MDARGQAGTPAPRRDLELLASVKSVNPKGAITSRCFGNILELGCDLVVLEAHSEQSAGAAVLLNVVFPGQRSNPVSTLHCVVRRVRDPQRLHYDLAIEDMDEGTRRSLVEFLSAPRAPRPERGS